MMLKSEFVTQTCNFGDRHSLKDLGQNPVGVP